MARLAYENERAISEMQSSRGIGAQTLTIAGAQYPYTPGRISLDRELEDGGFTPLNLAVFIIKRSLLATLPKSGTLLVDNKDSKWYRVEKVTDAADGSHASIECSDWAKGA